MSLLVRKHSRGPEAFKEVKLQEFMVAFVKKGNANAKD
jgi:hypothetical protein